MAKGRPRKSSDEDVFAAAARAMSRLSPTELTLADIADEAGLTAGALVQRYGSKRALLLKVMEVFSISASEMFKGLRAGAPTPLDAIRAYARCMAGMASSPEGLARSIAWLHQDIADPDFRPHLVSHAKGVRRELARLVREAIADGALREDADPRALAAAIDALIGGSLFAWAAHPEGKAEAFMARQIEALLAPWAEPSR